MDTSLTYWRSSELLQKDIERLEEELDEIRDTEESNFLGLPESAVLITLGALGILGSGQVAAWLLQGTMAPGTIQGIDFVQRFAMAEQSGVLVIGSWGPRAASFLGWLLILGLTAFHLLNAGQRQAGAKTPPLWCGWVLAVSLVALPTAEFDKGASVNILLGIAVSAGLFSLLPLLQRSGLVQRFFGKRDHDGESKSTAPVLFWAALAVVPLLAALIGFLYPLPAAALTGIFLASGLSYQVLLLGLHRRAKAASIAETSFRLSELRDTLAQSERQSWVEEQLQLFRATPTP